MRVLLAGGAGYIGAHTAVSLLDAGHEVVLLDDLSGTSAIAADRIETITGKPAPLVVGDAADDAVVESVFAEYGPIEAIVHLAAFKAVGESTQKPLEYYSNNVDTTFALLRVGLKHGIRSFVFSSTGTVYSDPADLPFTEESTTSIDLSNAYSKSKRINEVVLADVARVNPDLNVTVLRYFNPVGAHPSGLIGEDPAGIPNNLMPFVARVAVGKLEKIGVFGDDYDTPDGTGLRDYIHVVDLAEGHVTALEQAKPGSRRLQPGHRSARERARARRVVREGGGPRAAQADPRTAGRAMSRRPTATRPRPSASSGWKAQLTIDDSCRDYWNWQSRNPGRVRHRLSQAGFGVSAARGGSGTSIDVVRWYSA